MPLKLKAPQLKQLDRTQTLPDDRTRLQAALRLLTLKQRAGIDRIMAAEMLGLTIDSLLIDDETTGTPAMCSHSTYYGANGWHHNENFHAALQLARDVNWDLRLSATVRRTREKIVLAAPAAADKLIGFQSDDDHSIGLRAAESILNRASKFTADQTGRGGGVEYNADALAEAEHEAREWEASTFKKSG